MLSQVSSVPPADEEVTLTPCGVAGLLPMPQRRTSGDAEEFADEVDTDQFAAIVATAYHRFFEAPSVPVTSSGITETQLMKALRHDFNLGHACRHKQ